MKISEMGLSSRAYNAIIRAMPMYEFAIHAEDVIEHIPRLSRVRACGLGTMVDIIDTFAEHGYVVKSWEDDLKSLCKIKSEQDKVNALREKRLESKQPKKEERDFER